MRLEGERMGVRAFAEPEEVGDSLVSAVDARDVGRAVDEVGPW